MLPTPSARAAVWAAAPVVALVALAAAFVHALHVWPY
jgi:hypothetical protein